MLDTSGRISLGGASYAIHVALERRFRIVTIFRDGLVWDTRMLPTAIRPAQDRYYVLLEGVVTLFDGAPRVVRAPHAFRIRSREDSPENGTRVDVRGEGRPFRLFELHLHPPTVPEGERERWDDVPLPETLRDLCDRYEHEARAEGGDPSTLRAQLLAALVSEAWLEREWVDAIAEDEPSALTRTWSALAPLFRRLEMTPPLVGLADRASVSLRQVDRDFVALLGTFGLRTKSWRDTMQRYRLMLAVLMLSAEEATVASVASAVGYARPEAMAAAFRAADLPSPRVVQRVLRENAPWPE